MTYIANRIDDVEFSATLKVAEVIAKLRQVGEEVLAFNIGEPDFSTPQHIIAAARQALQDGFTHYTVSRGIPELREAVVTKSRDENKIPCATKNVIITPHIASATKETRGKMSRMAAENLIAGLAGKPPPNLVE